MFVLGVQINFEGFFGGPSFINPSKLIYTPNTFLLAFLGQKEHRISEVSLVWV